MSQFDYPRINFFGKCLIDPATANNGWYLPLVYFDPVTIDVFIPPRIYLQDEYLPDGKSIDDIRALLPAGAEIKQDLTTLFKGSYYVEITPVHDEPSFREWARVPLGEYGADDGYVRLYEAVYSPVNRGPLIGSIPGYWNYYGTMNYKYLDVKVSSVATGINDGKESLIRNENDEGPEDLRELIGASLTMNADLEDDSTNSAVMIDLLPSMAMYSQIFCDRLTLLKGHMVYLAGSPLKASLRLVNAFRVVNENMPFAGSGVFMSSMLMENIDNGESEKLIRLFKKYATDKRKLKGVFIYQVISEVEENRKIDYRKDGNIPNPAFATVSGRISPLYEDDMISWSIARQLIGDQPFLVGKNKDYDAPVSMLTPALFRLDRGSDVLAIDFLNNFPLKNMSSDDGPLSPDPQEKNLYEVHALGKVDICLEEINEFHEVLESLPLGSITIDEASKTREQLYSDGGMFHLPLPSMLIDNWNICSRWNLSVYATVNGKSSRIMTESPVVVVSDQAGLYCNQGDEPIRGYNVYSGKKENCIIRIFDRQEPVKKPMEITMVEFKMSSSGALRTDKLYRIEHYRDGDKITLDTSDPINAIYLFVPYRTHSLPRHGYPAAVVQTGFFINLKVLPNHDFGPYLDPAHPDYPVEVTFEVLYNNIFRRFGLMAPTMNFHKERFENPAMARELLRRMHSVNFGKSWYMPASRDVSEDQYLLIEKWAEKFQPRRAKRKDHEHSSSDKAHHKHLHGKLFFNK